jgi:hypothetical protein
MRLPQQAAALSRRGTIGSPHHSALMPAASCAVGFSRCPPKGVPFECCPPGWECDAKLKECLPSKKHPPVIVHDPVS